MGADEPDNTTSNPFVRDRPWKLSCGGIDCGLRPRVPTDIPFRSFVEASTRRLTATRVVPAIARGGAGRAHRQEAVIGRARADRGVTGSPGRVLRQPHLRGAACFERAR